MAKSLKRLLSDKDRPCGGLFKRLALMIEPIHEAYGLFSLGG